MGTIDHQRRWLGYESTEIKESIQTVGENMKNEISTLWIKYLEEKSKFKNLLQHKILNDEMIHFLENALKYEETFEENIIKHLNIDTKKSKKCLKFYTKWITETISELSENDNLLDNKAEYFINIFIYIQSSFSDKMLKQHILKR